MAYSVLHYCVKVSMIKRRGKRIRKNKEIGLKANEIQRRKKCVDVLPVKVTRQPL